MLGINLGIWASAWRAPTMGAYVRPADWLTLPSLGPTDQRIVGLFAVGDHSSNFCALNVTGTGSYVIDWGDGTSPETVASATTAYHNYSYSAAPLVGTESSRGYRQAIVSVTMASGNMTGINLNTKHSQSGLPTGYCVPWLDISLSAHNATSIMFGGSTVLAGLVEKITVVAAGAITNTTNMFQACVSLASLTLPAGFGGAITNTTNMFYNCYALASLTLPAGFGGAITTATSMFQACVSLASLTLPAGFGGAITNTTSMFQSCIALLEILGLSLPVLVTSTTMFSSAYSIRKASMSIPVAFTIAACMSAAELNALYTALPTAVGKTITCSGNYGFAASDITILNLKGWSAT